MSAHGWFRGFTLIEILVAVSIIAILGVVAIPNLRNFSKSQEIDASAQEVVNVLKTAQSSAQSRIKCPKGEVSDTWIVRLTTNNYSLVARCQTSGDEYVFVRSYSSSDADSATTFKGSISVCSGDTVDVIFSKSQINYLCFTQAAPQTGTISLTLTNSEETLSKIVKIESGGVIKVE